jgi:hypothetical protein
MWSGRPRPLPLKLFLTLPRVGRTLLSDAFDLDFALELALDVDREGHGFSRATK